jgi:PPOX class probable F420-dependent enzyme
MEAPVSNWIPSSHADLLSDACRAIAVLATVMPDGTPHATPVWFDVEGEFIRVNTARGRVKDRNMMARPDVSLCILDPGDAYRYLQVRGTVDHTDESGGRQHINKLASKYLGRETYPGPADEQRVAYYIHVRSTQAMG